MNSDPRDVIQETKPEPWGDGRKMEVCKIWVRFWIGKRVGEVRTNQTCLECDAPAF